MGSLLEHAQSNLPENRTRNACATDQMSPNLWLASPGTVPKPTDTRAGHERNVEDPW